MTSLRQRVIARGTVLCAVALVLLPLLLSAHRHHADQFSPSDTCALCVVTHFSPATTAPPLPQLPVPASAVATAALVVAPFMQHSYARPSGRAPPHSPLFRVA